MIEIHISNLEKIKKFHKGYFDNIVKEKWTKIVKKDDGKIDKRIIDFLKEIFYINDVLNDELMTKLCYGEDKYLQEFIGEFEGKYETYINTKDFWCKCLHEIEVYEKYLETTAFGSGEDRLNNWNICINKIIDILEDKQYGEESDNKIELKKIVEVEKQRIDNEEKSISRRLKISETYRVKLKMQQHINSFKKNFDSKTPKDILEQIFNYNEFCKNKKEFKIDGRSVIWNRHGLLVLMEVNVCPYCNRQFINSYEKEDQKQKSTADIDHFYIKSKYPYLGLSLYNYIPSCQICNSRLKLETDFYTDKHIYPYVEGFGDDAKFETKFLGEEDDDSDYLVDKGEAYDITYLMGNCDNFKIELKPKLPESEKGRRISNSINTFKLNKLYEFHKDYVRELIKKAIIYNESRIEELYTQYSELFRSREEVLQMIVSNYIEYEDLGKRPLAKLTKDICEELGLE